MFVITFGETVNCKAIQEAYAGSTFIPIKYDFNVGSPAAPGRRSRKLRGKPRQRVAATRLKANGTEFFFNRFRRAASHLDGWGEIIIGDNHEEYPQVRHSPGNRIFGSRVRHGGTILRRGWPDHASW